MPNWATIARLGDPANPQWQADNLTWIEPIKGQRWQVYKPAASSFEGLLNDLAKVGYHPTSSGGFNYRNIRGSDMLSQHAFGTAIDLNAAANAMGQSATDIPDAAQLAKKWGLEWGGNWKNRPDPMHFEYTGGGADPYAGMADGPKGQEVYAPTGPNTAIPAGPVEAAGGGAGSEAGQKAAIAPAGSPEADNSTFFQRLTKNIGKMGPTAFGNAQGMQVDAIPAQPAAAVMPRQQSAPFDASAADAQRQQLAMVMQRLNSGRLF